MKLRQETVIVSLCLLFVLLMVFADIKILGFQFLAYYFMFYTIGYYIHKYINVVTIRIDVLLLLTVVWAILVWFWRMDTMPTFLSLIPLSQALLHYVHRFVTAAIAVYVLFGVSPRLLDTDKSWNRFFLQAGRISLGLYTAHLLFIKIISGQISQIAKDHSTIVILSFAVALGVAWGTVWLLDKWKVSRKLFLGKI